MVSVIKEKQSKRYDIKKMKMEKKQDKYKKALIRRKSR